MIENYRQQRFATLIPDIERNERDLKAYENSLRHAEGRGDIALIPIYKSGIKIILSSLKRYREELEKLNSGEIKQPSKDSIYFKWI